MGANSSKIVNGVDLVPGEAPWQAALTRSQSLPVAVFCGGSLINANWVLSAAHCTYTTSASSVFAVLGMVSRSAGGLTIRIERQVLHPDWDRPNLEYDFTLLKLSTGVNLPEHQNIRPICWPTVPPSAGTRVRITGWGRLGTGRPQPNTLQGIFIPVLSDAQCPRTHNSRFCVGESGVSQCSGDSGGPVIAQVGGRWQVWGAVSFGPGGVNCEDRPYSVEAAVYSVRSWIGQNAGAECDASGMSQQVIQEEKEKNGGIGKED